MDGDKGKYRANERKKLEDCCCPDDLFEWMSMHFTPVRVSVSYTESLSFIDKIYCRNNFEISLIVRKNHILKILPYIQLQEKALYNNKNFQN